MMSSVWMVNLVLRRRVRLVATRVQVRVTVPRTFPAEHSHSATVRAAVPQRCLLAACAGPMLAFDLLEILLRAVHVTDRNIIGLVLITSRQNFEGD
jgi:hypothetical protein